MNIPPKAARISSPRLPERIKIVRTPDGKLFAIDANQAAANASLPFSLVNKWLLTKSMGLAGIINQKSSRVKLKPIAIVRPFKITNAKQSVQEMQVSIASNATSNPFGTPAVTRTSSTDPLPGSFEVSLLVNRPKGVVVKCINAKFVQSPVGHHIVIRGLKVNDFVPNQIPRVRKLVKIQSNFSKESLFKNPTKLYLAVHPARGVRFKQPQKEYRR